MTLFTEEWLIPDKYVQAVHKVLGRIDLDPNSSEELNQQIKAKMFYQDHTYSLDQKWYGTVFLSFPQTTVDLPFFVDKLISEWFLGRVEQAILLVPNTTEARWFQCLASKIDAICFVKGRVGLFSPYFKCTYSQGNLFCYFGNQVHLFMREFSVFGCTTCLTI